MPSITVKPRENVTISSAFQAQEHLRHQLQLHGMSAAGAKAFRYKDRSRPGDPEGQWWKFHCDGQVKTVYSNGWIDPKIQAK